jgi:hypothetical protein
MFESSDPSSYIVLCAAFSAALFSFTRVYWRLAHAHTHVLACLVCSAGVAKRPFDPPDVLFG